MGKKIFIVSGSPRKGGNSDTLCDRFALGANETGSITEKIFLRDKNINYCIGCNACRRNGGKCFQNDDMAETLYKLAASDVIVLATPVYFYSMSAQLKTFIDRVYAKYTELRGKELYFIATAADSEPELMNRTIEGLRGFAACLPGSIEKGIICVPGVSGIGEVKNSMAMEQAYEMGRNV